MFCVNQLDLEERTLRISDSLRLLVATIVSSSNLHFADWKLHA